MTVYECQLQSCSFDACNCTHPRMHGMIIVCDTSHTWIRKHKFWNWTFSFVEARILQVYKTRGALGTIAEINMLIFVLPVVNKDIQEYNAASSDWVDDIFIFWKIRYSRTRVYKTEEVNGRVYVNFCWCKVCAKNKDGIYKIPFFEATQNLPRWLSLMGQMLWQSIK